MNCPEVVVLLHSWKPNEPSYTNECRSLVGEHRGLVRKLVTLVKLFITSFTWLLYIPTKNHCYKSCNPLTEEKKKKKKNSYNF